MNKVRFGLSRVGREARWLTSALVMSALLAGAAGCSKPEPAKAPPPPPTPQEKSKNTINKAAFGTLPDGTNVDLYTMVNANGMEVRATNYGGIITTLMVPDGSGKLGDVVLGYNSLDGYLKSSPYFGAIIGRYGN